MNIYTISLHIVIVLLGIEVFILAEQNQQLKIEQAQGKGENPDLLKFGDAVPGLSTIRLDGGRETISYDDSSRLHLLFIFNTTCPACEKNLLSWIEMSEQINPEKCEILAISLHDMTSTRKYVSQKSIKFKVNVFENEDFLKRYKLNAVPQTLLIERGGIVKGVWVGPLSGVDKGEIRGLIEVPRPPKMKGGDKHEDIW
jgi:peroxiredoxin